MNIEENNTYVIQKNTALDIPIMMVQEMKIFRQESKKNA